MAKNSQLCLCCLYQNTYKAVSHYSEYFLAIYDMNDYFLALYDMPMLLSGVGINWDQKNKFGLYESPTCHRVITFYSIPKSL